jgi:hypothetical protein
MGLGINYVIIANHMISLITSSTTDPLRFLAYPIWISANLMKVIPEMYVSQTLN